MHQIFELTKREFLSNFKNSSLGIVWVFLRPIFVMSVMYFALSRGFKNTDSNRDFMSVFFIGQATWQSFSSILGSSSNIYKKYSFVIREPNFRIDLLVISNIFSNLLIHIASTITVILILIITGSELTFNPAYLTVYLFVFLSTSTLLSSIFALLNVFAEDFSKIIQLYLAVGFWATPIFWSLEMIEKLNVKYLLYLNPAILIVELSKGMFIPDYPAPPILLFNYFAALTSLLFIFRKFIYNKLRFRMLENL